MSGAMGNGYVMDYGEAFRIFDLPRTASIAEIDERYRQLAFACHPDTGGTDGEMARLNNARDAALAYASSEKSLTVRDVVGALATVGEQTVELQRRKDHAESVRRSVIDRNVRPYQRNRLAALVLGAVAGIGAFFSTQISPTLDTDVLLGGPLAVSSGVLALGALFAHYKVEFTKGLIETFTSELEDKALLANLVRELEFVLGTWFTQEELESALERVGWDSSLVPRTVRQVVGRLGPRDAARLVIVKGLEMGILVESETEGDEGEFRVTYSLRRPRKESSADRMA